MKIYTRKGDKGQTSLIGRSKVSKDSLRLEAYGTVDELNSVLGVARSLSSDARTREILGHVQQDLFVVGADLADVSGRKRAEINEKGWRKLEDEIDGLEADLQPLRNFILPGGTQSGSHIHLARTVCRRAERATVALQTSGEEVNADLLAYLNRLSDLLFVLARHENHVSGATEEIWKMEEEKS